MYTDYPSSFDCFVRQRRRLGRLWSVAGATAVVMALMLAWPAHHGQPSILGPQFAQAQAVKDQPSPTVVQAGDKTHTSESDDLDESSLQADRRPRRSNRGSAVLSQQDLPTALEVLNDFSPSLARKLGDWLKEHPDNARIELSRRVPWIVRLTQQRRTDPEGYKLAIADLRNYAMTDRLVKLLHQAMNGKDKDQARIDELTLKLKAVLADHFDLRQQIREREIQKLQNRVTQLRQQIDQQTQTRQQTLDARFKQLTQPNPDKSNQPKSHADKN